jgi:adhesin HecA-like repeat protein
LRIDAATTLATGNLDAGGDIALAGADIDTSAGTAQAGGAITVAAQNALVAGTLIAGTNLTLSGNSVDTTRGSLSAGTDLSIDSTTTLLTGDIDAGGSIDLAAADIDTSRRNGPGRRRRHRRGPERAWWPAAWSRGPPLPSAATASIRPGAP